MRNKNFLICFITLIILSCCSPVVEKFRGPGNGNNDKKNPNNPPHYEDCNIPFVDKTLSWEKHPDTDNDLKGFKFYHGINNSNYRFAGKLYSPEATTLKFSALEISINPCRANYFYMTAVDTSWNESEKTGTVCYGQACP